MSIAAISAMLLAQADEEQDPREQFSRPRHEAPEDRHEGDADARHRPPGTFPSLGFHDFRQAVREYQRQTEDDPEDRRGKVAILSKGCQHDGLFHLVRVSVATNLDAFDGAYPASIIRQRQC